MDPIGKHLVFVGGGHAHMTAMVNINEFIQKGHHVTLISSSPFHYYSGMGPGMLSGIYRPEEIRFNVQKMVEDRGGTFVEGHVHRVDPGKRVLKLDSGEEISYDVVSFNTGSQVPLETLSGVGEEMIPVKPIVNLLHARQWIVKHVQTGKPHLVVVGGGAAGIEMTGNIWRLVKDHRGEARITLLAGRKFLSTFPEKARQLAMDSLSRRGIKIIEGNRVEQFQDRQAVLTNGLKIPYDLVFLALGVRPSPLFRDSGLPTGNDGGLLVNRYLQSVDYPEIFGGGDCIALQDHPLDKVGVYAVRENPVLYHNLMTALEGGDMQSFDPGGPYLLILNLGNGKGVYWKNSWVWNGRLAFVLKNFIDKKFMRRFQVSGELAYSYAGTSGR